MYAILRDVTLLSGVHLQGAHPFRGINCRHIGIVRMLSVGVPTIYRVFSIFYFRGPFFMIFGEMSSQRKTTAKEKRKNTCLRMEKNIVLIIAPRRISAAVKRPD
jgi:hypothetical protein